MRVAIDTNRLTDLFRGDQGLAELLSTCEEVCVPLQVFAETTSGILLGSKRAQMEATLRVFMSKETVRLLLPTQRTAEVYAGLYAQLRSAGTPIPIGDIWIAAQSLEEGVALITRDTHFSKLAQLNVI